MGSSSRTLAASDNPFSVHRILPGAIPYLFSHEDTSTDLGQLDRLIESWQTNGYLGQIIGAHGCGKTTLAYAIAKRALENRRIPFTSVTSLTIRTRSLIRPDSPPSRLAWLLRLHSTGVTLGTFGTSADSVDATSCLNPNPTRKRGNPNPSLTCRVEKLGSHIPTKTILVIDGIERLTLTQQALMCHSLKRRQVPTLFTAHRVSKRLSLVGGRCPVLFRAGSDIRVFAKIVHLMTRPPEHIDHSVVEATFKSCGGNIRDAFMVLYDVFDSNNST